MNGPGPMQANPLKGTPKPGSILEPKFDGIRAIVHKVDGDLSIYSRTGKDMLGKLPHLEAAFRSIPFSFTLDGEVIDVAKVVRIEGQDVPISSRSGTQSVIGSSKGRRMSKRLGITYVVFDTLSCQDTDLTDVPDYLRRGVTELLVDILATKSKNVLLTARWMGNAQKLFDEIVAVGGEGLMVKNPLKPYQPAETPQDTWSKMKAVSTADVVIVGYKPGEGKYRGLVGSVEFGQYKDGKLTPRSACSGMDDATRRHLTEHADDYINKVMEIKYNGRVGPKRSFGHPQFLRIRDDKLPDDCTWD